MKRIAFAVEKGGTGKTTSAVHLAHGLALLGRKVLLVDTDTQDQCAAHLGVEQFQPGLAEIILGEIAPRQGIVLARENLFLLPAGDKLAGVKARLSEIADRAGAPPERLLDAALSFIHTGKLDYLILDSAPGSDTFLVNVLLYADTIITPTPPEMMAIRGVKRFFRTVRLLGKEVDYILPTFHDLRVAKTARILAKLQTHFGERVLDKISYASTISEAAGAGLTIFEYRPKQRIAEEYSELAKRIDNGTLP